MEREEAENREEERHMQMMGAMNNYRAGSIDEIATVRDGKTFEQVSLAITVKCGLWAPQSIFGLR